MWTALFDRPRRAPTTPPFHTDEVDTPPDGACAPIGWHESSWVLACGVEVVELPAADAAQWFGAAAA
jgi:hypothetical protein